MATLLSSIETQARRHLLETTASFWTSTEIIDLINKGIFDLWRDTVDLKQEHYLTIDTTNVSMAANTSTLTGVPSDVHKIYLIEPTDVSSDSSNKNLFFVPRDYNHPLFQSARTRDAISPSNDTIFYHMIGAGAPTAAPTVRVAPQVNSAVTLSFCYVSVIAPLTSAGNVPIPGEADNALIAWTVAYARAKEREDRAPDPGWLAVYATEKQHLLQSLGLRQLQEAQVVDGVFDDYWI